ncbi:rod shape-determining protein MreC [soil metagenome]
MARHADPTTELARGVRRIAAIVLAAALVGVFLLWRVENERVEQFRAAIADRFVPSFEWTVQPAAFVGRMLGDFQSYTRVYQQNDELRRELQAMRGWREAALQLEQKNAQLLALNNVRLSPRLTFVTGEVVADSGSPFRRSAMVNIGRGDGVRDGAVALDGLGLVGRISGVGEASARIIFLSDPSSRVPVIVRPSGQRAILSGDNTAHPVLDFLESLETARPGDRVVSSGDGGLFPPELLIGQVVVGPDGRHRVRPAADFRRLHFVRVIRPGVAGSVDEPGGLIGPLVSASPPAAGAAAAEPEAGEAGADPEAGEAPR